MSKNMDKSAGIEAPTPIGTFSPKTKTTMSMLFSAVMLTVAIVGSHFSMKVDVNNISRKLDNYQKLIEEHQQVDWIKRDQAVWAKEFALSNPSNNIPDVEKSWKITHF